MMNPVPRQVVVAPGNEREISLVVDAFSVETKEYIAQAFPGENYFFIKGASLCSQGVVRDEDLRYLLWKDRVVAGVLCTRNDFNNILYTFFRSFDEVERLSRKDV